MRCSCRRAAKVEVCVNYTMAGGGVSISGGLNGFWVVFGRWCSCDNTLHIWQMKCFKRQTALMMTAQ